MIWSRPVGLAWRTPRAGNGHLRCAGGPRVIWGRWSAPVELAFLRSAMPYGRRSYGTKNYHGCGHRPIALSQNGTKKLSDADAKVAQGY